VDCSNSYALENAHSILRESETVLPVENNNIAGLPFSATIVNAGAIK